MFNVAVLRLKDIIKYFVGFIIVLVAIMIFTKYFSSYKKNTGENIEQIGKQVTQYSFITCMDETLPVISEINQTDDADNENDTDNKEEKNLTSDIFEQMLQTQISSIKGIENAEKNNAEKNNAEKNNAEKNNTEMNSDESSQEENNAQVGQKVENSDEKIQQAETGLPTQIVTNNPIQESFNVQYGKVKIKNQTEYTLTDEILNPNITIENKNIILFHTHSCESYTSSELYPYTPTGNFRTTDLNFTVTRVGTELENQLKQYNYNVIHSKDYHDYPAYNGSYTRSLATVENILKTTKADIIMDVHRDAIGSRSDYAPCVKIGDQDIAAQIMFVIGTNNGGLWHPNWQQNLKFAVKIQQKAEEMYPRFI